MAKKQAKTEVKMLPVHLIHPNAFGMREHIDQDGIHDLGKSIDEAGLLEPVLVRPDPNMPGHYELIAGERRWLAHKDAHIPEISATVRDVPNDLEAMELSLAENSHRAELTPKEQEDFLGKLWDTSNPETITKDGTRLGKQARYQSIEALAQKTGMSQDVVNRYILARKDRIQSPVRIDPKVTPTDLALTRVLENEPEIRKQILDMRASGELTKDKLVDLVKVVKEQPLKLQQHAISLVAAGQKVEDARRQVEALATVPDEQVRKQVIDLKLASPDDVQSLVKVVVAQPTPALQQHALNLMQQKAQPVADIQRQLDFLKTAPEHIRQEIIATKQEIEVPAPVQEITPVEIPEDAVEEWHKNEVEQEEVLEKVRNNPIIQERIKLRTNYIAHSALLRVLGDARDPLYPEEDWHNLVWKHSGLNIQEAQKKLADMLRQHDEGPDDD